MECSLVINAVQNKKEAEEKSVIHKVVGICMVILKGETFLPESNPESGTIVSWFPGS